MILEGGHSLHPQGDFDLPAHVKGLYCGKNPPGLDSAPAVPLEPLGKKKKPQQTLTNPSSSCRNKPMVVMGMCSIFAFWGQILWDDELEHQERKTLPLLVNTKSFFFRGTGEEVVSSSTLAPLGLPGAQSQAQVQLLNNRYNNNNL